MSRPSQIIRMSLSDANSTMTRINNAIKKDDSVKAAGTSLTGPMIGRIHLIKPGCGSCGRSH
jgi:hypothetical protein